MTWPPQRSRAEATRVVTALLLVLSLSLGVAVCQAARSCTNQGQVHVPCEDALALEPSEKFLITLVGHSCYEIRLSAQAPLDVFFYEAEGSFYAWRLREMQAIQPPDLGLLGGVPVSTGGDADTTSGTNNSAVLASTTNSNSTSVSDHLCDRSLNCHRIMHGLARRGVYNLVLAYSRDTDMMKKADGEGILLSLESCDQVSLSHIFGLLLVACMGFVSVMLCLCLLGEYALGLRSMTKFRRTLQRHHQFIELAQVEPKKDLDCSDDSSSSSSDSPTSPMLPPAGPPATPKVPAAAAAATSTPSAPAAVVAVVKAATDSPASSA